MTTERAPETRDSSIDTPSQDHRPGYCSLHPNQRLVTRSAAGIRRYGYADDAEVICVMCKADALDPTACFRCRSCGGRLFTADTPAWRVSERRAFCGHTCRQRDNRARFVLGNRGEHVRSKDKRR